MWINTTDLTLRDGWFFLRLLSLAGCLLIGWLNIKRLKTRLTTTKAESASSKPLLSGLKEHSEPSNGEAIPDAFFSHFMAEWRDHVQPFDRK